MKFLLVLCVSLSSMAHASVVLNCDSTDGAGTVQDITIEGDIAKVTSTDRLNGMTFTATIDNSYQPRGVTKLRFIDETNDWEVIIPKSLLKTRTKKGFVQLRGYEDGFWALNYACTK